MEFTEFEKMRNSLSSIDLGNEFKKVDWIVTEKIHGANFSFHCDGENVLIARRRAFLEENENFFNCQTAEFLKPTKEKVKNLFKILQEDMSEVKLKQISVYGELFGGLYKTEGQGERATIKPIQREIQYCAHIDWLAYDIAYDSDDAETHNYIDADKTIEYFNKTDIAYIKPLCIGKMNDALTYELGFDSTIPAYFGLPSLPKGTNKAEGIVAKPIKNMFMKNKHGEEERAIVKIKLPEFDDMRTQQQKKPTAQKGGKVSNKKSKPQNVIGQLAAYASDRKVQSAITKMGDVYTPGNREKVTNECLDDVFRDVKEFDEDLYSKWEKLSENEKKKNKEIIRKKIVKHIDRYIFNDMTNT